MFKLSFYIDEIFKLVLIFFISLVFYCAMRLGLTICLILSCATAIVIALLLFYIKIKRSNTKLLKAEQLRKIDEIKTQFQNASKIELCNYLAKLLDLKQNSKHELTKHVPAPEIAPDRSPRNSLDIQPPESLATNKRPFQTSCTAVQSNVTQSKTSENSSKNATTLPKTNTQATMQYNSKSASDTSTINQTVKNRETSSKESAYQQSRSDLPPKSHSSTSPNSLLELYVPCFNLDTLDVNDLLEIYRQNKNRRLSKVVILCNDYTTECATYAKNFQKIAYKLVSIKELFVSEIEKQNFYPNIEVETLSKEKMTLSKLKKHVFDRKRAKSYFFCGIILLFSSYFVPLRIYYLLFSGIMFISSLTCILTSKFKSSST